MVIFLTRGMIRLLPSNRRRIARFSDALSGDPYAATTAANARADGPLADAADAADTGAMCPMAQDNARIASRFMYPSDLL
jgi:hypothetical protein